MSSYGIKAGRRFGRLVALELVSAGGRDGERWLFQCDCGKQHVTRACRVFQNVKSCGCLRRDLLRARQTKHGYCGTKIHEVWRSMKARCERPSNTSYPRYGARGIRVCARWQSFESFLADMGEPPSGAQLDRINNDGHYEPSNCRWVTPSENSRNRRGSIKITYNGMTKHARDWADELGIPFSTLRKRMLRGVPIERLFVPPGLGRRLRAG